LPIDGKGTSDWAYAWVPIVGPIIGGMTGTLFYKAMFQNQFGAAFWVFSLLSVGIIIYSVVYKKKL
jgi:glycerol uptake facilitator protein